MSGSQLKITIIVTHYSLFFPLNLEQLEQYENAMYNGSSAAQNYRHSEHHYSHADVLYVQI